MSAALAITASVGAAEPCPNPRCKRSRPTLEAFQYRKGGSNWHCVMCRGCGRRSATVLSEAEAWASWNDSALLVDADSHYSTGQIEEIARGLTDRQRRYLPILGDEPFICWEGVEEDGALAERCGWYPRFGGHPLYRLTPLGKAVRQHLRGEA